MTENSASKPIVPTRRSIVRAAVTVLGASAALVARRAPVDAAPTISKAAVAYQDEPQGGKQCDKCVQFVAPSSCKIVEGTISPHGSCRIFQPLSRAS